MKTKAGKSGCALRETTDHGQRKTSHASLLRFHVLTHHRSMAFTLLEVMIACGIFFLASFSILALVSSALKNARSLQRIEVDAGMAAAQVIQLFKTNREPDLAIEGNFGDSYPDYTWAAEGSEYDTNGLLQVQIIVNRRGSHNNPVDAMQILVYSPNVKSKGFGSSLFR
jgi:type II secretory pathway pseudopilin PulG